MLIFEILQAALKQMLFFSCCAFGLFVASTELTNNNLELPSLFGKYIIKEIVNSIIGQPSRRHGGGGGRVGVELKLTSFRLSRSCILCIGQLDGSLAIT